MTRNILLIHGANLNRLGQRDARQYGSLTLKDIEHITQQEAKKVGYYIIPYQSNHEGNIIDYLQSQASACVGIIINPGAFTHYSFSLYDALLDTNLPVIEVHLSDLTQREIWRRQSVISPACIKVIMGKKEQGYREAVCLMKEYLESCHST